MPTTSNFGWTTPADTDLVKDGAAAIRTLGNGIDTSFLDLKGGTTGQVLSKNSNTDLDFIWVAQDDSNAIQNAIVDAKGDLISATAADTPARLASSGVNGDVLTVDTSTATGLKWAAPGGADPNYTLLNTGGTSLSGSTTTVTFTAHNSLLIGIQSISTNQDNAVIDIRFNSDSGSNYFAGSFWIGAASSGYNQEDQQATRIRLLRCNSAGSSDNRGYIQVWGAKTSGQKPYNLVGTGEKGGLNNGRSYVGVGRYSGSSAITSVSVISDAGDFDNGTIFIYGSN